MSTAAPPAPPAAPDAGASPQAPPAEPQDNYSFESALDNVLEQAGGDVAKALATEAPPKEPKAPVAPKEPKTPVEPKEPKAAPKDPVDPKDGDKEPKEQADDDASLLSDLLKGDDITDDKLNKPKPGDAPTDPNDRAFKTWAELRADHGRLAKEKADLEKKLAEVQGQIPKDYDDIKKELQGSKDYISKLDLSQRPEFQREVTIPIDSITKEFEGIAERIGVSKALLMEAINNPDEGKREEALAKILSENATTVSQGTVAKMYIKADELHRLYTAEQQYMENAPKMMEQLRKQEAEAKEKQEATAKEEFARASNVAAQVLGKTIPFLKEADGTVKAETLEALKADAAKDFGSLKPAQRALALMAPGLLQRALEVNKSKDAEVAAAKQEVASLKLQLAKLAGASPSTATSGGGGSPPAEKKATSDDPFENMSSLQLSKLPV